MKPYYSRKGIEIYCGDSLELMPKLSRRKRIDLVLTDPPYSIKNVGGGGFNAKLYNDPKFRVLCNFDPGPFVSVVSACFAASGARLNLVCTCSRDLVPQYARISLDERFVFDLHAWHKPNAVPFTHNTFKSDLEYIILLYQSRRPFQNGLRQDAYSKLFTHNTIRTKVHPTQKPEDLMTKYARILCPKDGRLLDPYMGGGTTLVAAQALGLKAIGIEHDREYCDRAIERLEAA